MSATATLPLPLELTQPVELSSSLEDAIREAFDTANAKYNDETQVRENPEGSPRFGGGGGHGGTSSSQECESCAGLVVIDVNLDVQIDDNDF
jgi:hypothetical protein